MVENGVALLALNQSPVMSSATLNLTSEPWTITWNNSLTTPNITYNSTWTIYQARWPMIGLGIIPFWILTGNILVLLSVCQNRALRTLSNYVIASLALTDFLLALFVVPLGVYQTVRIVKVIL